MDATENPWTLLIRDHNQVQAVLQQVAKNVGFDLPPEASEKIAEDSNGNLRKATLVLEALKMQS